MAKTKGEINPAPISDAKYEARERQYHARDALSILTRADEIRRDKSLMRDVKAEAKRVVKTASLVIGRKPKQGT